MSTLPLFGVFAVLVFFGVFASSEAQLADHVVINEIDTNPLGDDYRSPLEWVELYNPTDEAVDIGGWQVASTSISRKTLTFPAGTVIKPGQFLVYSNTLLWFTDVSERVQLKDKPGNIIDETPSLTDLKNDFSSWQRKADGLDTDATNDWVFKSSTAGSSNGKMADTSASSGGVTIFVNADKRGYAFSDTAVLYGNVSERVYQEKPFFSQQQISILVDGPGIYEKKFTLYPDAKLNFKTSMKLDKVLGVTSGTYTVFAKYGTSDDTALFTVGDKAEDVVAGTESELTISADKIAYMPGERVKITGQTNKIIPLEGLKMAVYDAKGKQIYTGNLYPTPDGKFSGNVFVTTVNSVYGTYDIIADYGKQHAETAFEVVPDVKDTENIVLSTDKKFYAPGEAITISGRSNKYVSALDLEVVQTGTGSVGNTVGNVFKIKDQVTLAGDSTFTYELKVPSGQANLGDFRVTVSKEFGKAITYFKIVENPDDYIEGEDKNFVTTDKAEYALGEKMIINGHVLLKTRSTYEAIPVYVAIQDESGKPLSIVGKDKKLRVRDGSIIAEYGFTAIPDAVGNYKIDLTISRTPFKPGTYVIKTNYDGLVTTTSFSVVDDLDIKNRNIVAKTDKTVYGLGEKVSLDGTLVSGQSAVKITLTKPDGKTVSGGAKVDNSKFSWSWDIPTKDYELADIRDPKSPRMSVFGNYKITITASSETIDVYFKVSKNPATDKLEIRPLEITTDKSLYRGGEKLTISGSAIKREQVTSTGGGIIPDRVSVQVKTSTNKVIYNSAVDFDIGNHFTATYDLPLTIFKDGKYKVTATYQKIIAEATFEVKNNIPFDPTGKLTIILNTDKEEYSPGDTIHVTGNTNKVISLKKLDLVIIPEESTKVNCGNFECGLGGKKTDISRSYDNGVYSYDYTIPSNAVLGTYVIKVDAEFGTFTKTFKLVEKKAPEPIKVFSTKISEKFNRLTDSEIDILLEEKTLDGQVIAPWSLQGSMVTSRGAESQVNIKIVADDGQCIIGPDAECLVSKATKSSAASYKTVKVAGIDYNVEYSGPQAILEKFSIVPVSDEAVIPDSTWSVQIVKDDQPSKFYYEIVYKPIQ